MATEPIDWETVEAAVYQWLTEISSIVDNVIWEDQNVPQPNYPYASVKFTAQAKEGGRDEIRTDTDLITRAAGEEIRMINTGPVGLTLPVSFHHDPNTLTNASPVGETAMALAMKAQSSLGMQTVLDHFGRANVAIVRERGIQDTSVFVNGEWLSRATLDVAVRTHTTMTEYTGYINKVELSSVAFGVDLLLDSTEE